MKAKDKPTRSGLVVLRRMRALDLRLHTEWTDSKKLCYVRYADCEGKPFPHDPKKRPKVGVRIRHQTFDKLRRDGYLSPCFSDDLGNVTLFAMTKKALDHIGT